ncbi:DMT family transporter [Candidatus Galacturonibacter soehngenii]|uniref:EamA family transporter n=1 Tax=Candidatus Galacturonatibacter soehngenii TaxID=2307010 RepID=A0A7V7QJE3_9FIRM|nr:DMT family transporter [Candidatus Galacturonibacter soehngenii]KAB1437601.1 EamA family transporter [Candidatus Galacturonibacter soehngenii]MBA4686827.1 DMT family transporter [Candidatus Galacturonibacter soehngenii]
MYIILAILSGVTIVVSRMTNAKLGKELSVYQSTFFNYVVGFIGSMLAMFLFRATFLFEPHTNGVRFYAMFLGGVLGVIMIIISNIITPKISAFSLTIIIFVSQLFSGVILDYFLFEQLSAGKVIGGTLVLIGLIFNTKA